MLDFKSQYEVAIGALLHDIGKFKQRAYKGNESHVRIEVRDMQGYIAKLNSKTKLYTHRHALWTYDFFINDFKPIIDHMDFDIKLNWEKVYISSASHHHPSDDNYSPIIQKADIRSSSNDRSDATFSYEKGDYYKKPLRSIFTQINTEKESTPQTSSYYYPLSSSDKESYPKRDDSHLVLDYLSLWTEFISALQQLPTQMTLNELLIKLKDLLYQYTWCIPSATNDVLNDISLYDHSVTTMVFALALANTKKKDKIRIFAADISGIQQYIFQSKYSSFKGAAKTFRGRSFLISSISNAYRIALCNHIGLIPFIDLIDAGGKFTLLLPSDDALIPQIDAFVKDQELYFFKKYQGTLCVLTEYSLEVDCDAFSKGKFVETQKEIGYRLNSKKTRKFEKCVNDIGYVVHDMNIEGTRCPVCGKNTITHDEKQICDTCESIQRIGASLLTHHYINYNSSYGYEMVKGVCISIDDSILTHNYMTFSLKHQDNKYPLWRLNTHSPNETFDAIAQTSVNDEGLGKNFLAYVKIDVDNLGEIFIGGFSSEIYTISRYVTLSRLLNHFFNVLVRNLLEQQYQEAYTVISGGDDIFIILPWNQALEFIKELKQKFTLFCCNNEQIHFSTGIVVGHSKEPFALLNQRANEQLDEKAKEKEGKNCTSYFDTLFDNDELNILIEESKVLKQYIEEDGLSSSFIYRIYNYVKDLLSEDNRRIWSVCSKIRYDLVRNIKIQDEKKKAEIFCFFLNHINNYKSREELERFKVVLVHTMYGLRKN